MSMNNSSGNEYLVSKGYAWYVFFLLSALMLFDFIDRQVIAALFPFFKKEWGISDTQCGLLVAAVNWSITLFAVPVAIMADRWSRKKTVGLMAIFWSLATAACAFTKNFSHLFTARFMIGVGEAGYGPAGNALIAALFPQRLRGRMCGIFVGAANIGAALGVILGGWIAVRYGWRHAFGLVAIPGLIFAILLFFIRDYKTVELTISAAEAKNSSFRRAMSKKEIIKALSAGPALWGIYIGEILAIFFIGVILNWLPSFFIRTHKMGITQATMMVGLFLFLVFFSSYLGGTLGDKLVMRGRANGRILAAAIGQLVSFLLFITAFGLAQGQLQIILLYLGALVLSTFVGPVYSSIVELVHVGLRSTVVSTMTLLQNLAGFAIGPVFAGAVSDRFGIATAMIVSSFFPLASMVFFIFAASFFARDAAKIEKVEIQIEG